MDSSFRHSRSISRSLRRVLGPVCFSSACALAGACSSDNAAPPDSGSPAPVEAAAATCADGGTGITAGPADTHCQDDDGGAIIQTTSASSCHPGAVDASSGPPASTESMQAGIDDGTCGNPDYGPTMYGTTGSDDDCKYDVTWEAMSPICENEPVYFKVTATSRATGMPLTGADTIPEPVLACLLPAQGTFIQPTPEPSAGTYTVGPVIFQKAGQWDVRFHFNESCEDTLPDSPHGHAAFWVTVP